MPDPERADYGSRKRMIRGFIFDLDGTLLDSLQIWENLGERYVCLKGLVPEEHLSEILFPLSLEEGVQYLSSHYPIADPPEQILQEILQMIHDFYFFQVKLKPDVKETLRTLQERDCGIAAATAGDPQLARAALRRNGILEYFSGILTCDEAGAGKSEPVIFELAAEHLGLKKEECMVVEDSLTALRTAKNAGFLTCGIYDRYSREDPEEIRKTADRYIGRGDSLLSLTKEAE